MDPAESKTADDQAEGLEERIRRRRFSSQSVSFLVLEIADHYQTKLLNSRQYFDCVGLPDKARHPSVTYQLKSETPTISRKYALRRAYLPSGKQTQSLKQCKGWIFCCTKYLVPPLLMLLHQNFLPLTLLKGHRIHFLPPSRLEV